jgi:hypothetical protein
MEPAQRKTAMPAVHIQRPPAADSWLDDRAIDGLLGADVGEEDGNAVAGIRNGVFAGAAIWIAVGLLLLAFVS